MSIQTDVIKMNDVQPSFKNSQEAVAWITSLFPVKEKPGLERMNALMEHFDHPQRRLKFIHVAGTNGKGSTCALLTSALVKAGYDVGTFTSPYLVTFADRIRFNGVNIPEEDLLNLANRIKPVADQLATSPLGEPTMFEVTTAIALLYFATMVYPDYVVWETGIGGRFDSTNIVHPVISVITNIGHDHADMLGHTVEEITREKAGIIKPGVPVVSAVEQPEAVQMIRDIVNGYRGTLYLLGEQFHYEPILSTENAQQMRFRGPFRMIDEVPLTLAGEHQMKNAVVALMTLEVLRQYYALIVDDDVLFEAFRETQWPGRLEQISDKPRIVLDGAHNPEGAEVLAQALKNVYKYKKLHMMVGMLQTKNHTSYIGHILPLVDTLIITEPQFRKKITAEALAEKVRQMSHAAAQHINIVVEPDWRQALELLERMTEEGDLAVVSGTLYLISDVRSSIINRSDT